MTIPPDPSDETIRSAGRSAAIVSAITLASRLMGLVRTLIVTSVLGITFLGNTYSSANALPNLLFEIIAGGAVAAALLPAIAGAATAGRRDEVGLVASGVLNRAVLLVTPVILAGILLREPLMRLLTSAVRDPEIRTMEVELGSFLLIMFLPQIWLYTVGVVSTAVLHAFHRFAAPALAPLLSSMVVSATYLLYGLVEGPNSDRLEAVSSTGKLILGLGTTAGVAVLSLSLLPAVRRLNVSWRATLELPGEARRKIRALAGPAVATMGVQQVFLAVVLIFANRVEGGVVAYQLAFTTLLVFWAVFPLPVATTLFPGLAASAAEPGEFASRSAQAGRQVMVIVVGAAALMLALADPLAGLVVELGAGASGPEARRMVALTIACFAPGLVGYGLYALYTRAAYALGDGRSPALAAVFGFGLGVALNALAATIFDGARLVAALAAGFSVGIAAGALQLIVLFRRRSGAAAVDGLLGSFLRSAGCAVVAGGAGLLVARVVEDGSLAGSVIQCAAVGTAVVLAYLGCQLMLGNRQIASLFRSSSGKVKPAAGSRT